MSRRSSRGHEMAPGLYDGRSYYDHQLSGPGHDEVLPDSLELRIAWFLNRWHWRGDRTIVERELRELIQWSKVNQ